MTEEIRLPANNDVRRVRLNGRYYVLKRHLPKPRTFKFYKYAALSWVGWPIPVEYWPEGRRCAYEGGVLRHWALIGYLVPALHESEEKESLLMDYIEGETMQAVLEDSGRALSSKLALVEAMLVRSNGRYRTAIAYRDHRLVHFDSNLRNIIVAGNDFYRIDFEMGRTSEPIERSIAREIHKCCLEAIRALGSDSRDSILNYARLAVHDLGIDRYLKSLFSQNTRAEHRTGKPSRERSEPTERQGSGLI